MYNREQLNCIYEPPVKKSESVLNVIKTQYNKATYGFYNNHFHKNDAKEYVPDYFPIPVITVENLCDMEFDFEFISITSKLLKYNAAEFEYDKLSGIKFEIYGVDDYLKDYYTCGLSLDESVIEIRKSNEEEFFYTFYFDNDTDNEKLSEFLYFLENNGFFY